MKRLIAVVATASLIGSAAAETWKFDMRHNVADAPHNHTETPAEIVFDVSSPLSASGAHSDIDRYRLHIAPADRTDDEDRSGNLVGYLAYTTGAQRMYARFETLDGLLQALESTLGLPQAQLDAIRQSLLNGNRTEIGWQIAGLSFPAKVLSGLGLRFGVSES